MQFFFLIQLCTAWTFIFQNDHHLKPTWPPAWPKGFEGLFHELLWHLGPLLLHWNPQCHETFVGPWVGLPINFAPYPFPLSLSILTVATIFLKKGVKGADFLVAIRSDFWTFLLPEFLILIKTKMFFNKTCAEFSTLSIGIKYLTIKAQLVDICVKTWCFRKSAPPCTFGNINA